MHGLHGHLLVSPPLSTTIGTCGARARTALAAEIESQWSTTASNRSLTLG